MRSLVLMALFALQLSVFTCGFNIHVHAMDADMGHVAEHIHDQNQHEESSADHACHVHTSHTFAAFKAGYVEHFSQVPTATYHVSSAPKLKNLPYNIEYPPKILRS